MRTWMIAVGVSVLVSASAGAETLVCKQPDGSEVITNAPTGGVCKPYVSEGTLNEVPDLELQRLQMLKPNERAQETERRSDEQTRAKESFRDLETGGGGTGGSGGTGSATTPPRSVQRQSGQITFEQFRMLSTGMTEGQVLAKIGAPASQVTISCTATSQGLTQRNQGTTAQNQSTTVTCPMLWTYIMGDGWTGDLTFFEGRLVDIQNTKTP